MLNELTLCDWLKLQFLNFLANLLIATLLASCHRFIHSLNTVYENIPNSITIHFSRASYQVTTIESTGNS
ncbi:hypothetical protein T01_423 [Trichinella spiralis]|uniref:Uncharacterized protein n=1 Tax=Trichinella spiralis TaxID=6334 RepID=A0A0V1B543_TRISP|nr:hypothetical protein T01_423 [Trichinella spiralis]